LELRGPRATFNEFRFIVIQASDESIHQINPINRSAHLNFADKQLECESHCMRQRWKVFVFFLAVVTIIAVCLCAGDKEPSYKGRPMSEWLGKDADRTKAILFRLPPQPDAISAVQAMGTNAIPLLVKWTKQDGLDFDSWNRASSKIPFVRLRKRVSEEIWKRSDQRRHAMAEEGLRILGTNAISALPEIARQFNTSKDIERIDSAGLVLARMGEKGFDVLLSGLDSPNTNICWSAITSIEDMGHNKEIGLNRINARPAVAKLTNIISYQTNSSLRVSAVLALDALVFSIESQEVFLDSLRNDPDKDVRDAASNAVATIRFFARANRRVSTN
jgi:hypothetical protein